MMKVGKAGIVLWMLLLSRGSIGQDKSVTISGSVKDQASKAALPYVNVVLKTETDSAFVTGTLTHEDGRFTLSKISPGNYIVEFSFVGYRTEKIPLYVGILSDFLDMTTIELVEDTHLLNDIVITATQML